MRTLANLPLTFWALIGLPVLITRCVVTAVVPEVIRAVVPVVVHTVMRVV